MKLRVDPGLLHGFEPRLHDPPAGDAVPVTDTGIGCLLYTSVPIAFLIIWLSRNHQKKLFEKQVDAKLAASDPVSYTHLDVYKRQVLIA